MRLRKTLFLLTFMNVCGMFPSSRNCFGVRGQNEKKTGQDEETIAEIIDMLIEGKLAEQTGRLEEKKTRRSPLEAKWWVQRREQSGLASASDSSDSSDSFDSFDSFDSSDPSVSHNPFDPFEPFYPVDPFAPASPFDPLGPLDLPDQCSSFSSQSLSDQFRL